MFFGPILFVIFAIAAIGLILCVYETDLTTQNIHPQIPTVEIQYTMKDLAQVPSYATEGSVGMDLYSNEDTFRLWPGQRKDVRTGISMALPVGYELQIRPRSGWARKHGITVLNAPGTIDSDYRGEIQVILINAGRYDVEINRGERIAQGVVAPVVRGCLHHVQTLDETTRGSGGFGSTGTK